tara:strand:+ start:2649 stop:2780 length:132 start_codon:yes stop_codon:yes gene_type:complete
MGRPLLFTKYFIREIFYKAHENYFSVNPAIPFFAFAHGGGLDE